MVTYINDMLFYYFNVHFSSVITTLMCTDTLKESNHLQSVIQVSEFPHFHV
jgi:hypothetical protein